MENEVVKMKKEGKVKKLIKQNWVKILSVGSAIKLLVLDVIVGYACRATVDDGAPFEVEPVSNDGLEVDAN